MRLGCLNVGGWSLIESENSYFRRKIVESLDFDIFCVNETFLRKEDSIIVNGYTFYSNNRTNIHRNAKRGSGGVGIFVKNELMSLYNVSILDATVEDILWLKFSSENCAENIVICACYLPPSESTRVNDPDIFYSTLLEQVYAYQNEGRLFICGDFNSRVGDAAEYIEGVDDVRPRDVIDHSTNTNGDLLIEFLVDCGMCMVNGRVGHNDFTHVSHRGRSVVDYVCVPYEQLSSVSEFQVHLMSDLVNLLDCRGVTKVPDHSVLTWAITSGIKHRRTPESIPNQTSTQYNTRNIPISFLNDAECASQLQLTIDKIEHDLDSLKDVNRAYNAFKDLIFSEMDRKLPKRNMHSSKNKSAKSFYKPYWSEELDSKWETVCKQEKVWLKHTGSGAEKRRLRTLYVAERRQFEKMNKKAKKHYQLSEQQRLLNLQCEHNTRDFWKEIGKLGIHNERKMGIPMEVVDASGNVSNDTGLVISRWKNDYEQLFDNSVNPDFDDAHLENVKKELLTNSVPFIDRDTSILNQPISKSEVENSICRAKLKRAAGLDGIPAEVLRNPACVDLLYKMINFCFENGSVPSEWNTGVIKPIPKSDANDPRNPLSYRGICLISVPCKIYADILNVRLSDWIEQNNAVVDEQNGFRRKRSCMEHIYTLYSVINKRKQQRQSTFVCFVDAKKAFDTVQRDCLWYKLMSLGIKGKILTAVQSLYNDVKCAVKVNEHLTPFINVHQGVKQGCKISPTLFSLYINDLANEIKQLNLGVEVNDLQLSLLLYADDIALVAPNVESLQIMMSAMNKWCNKWRLSINKDKTKVVHFRPASVDRCDTDFTCGNLAIEITDKYKYLGLWFQEHLDMKFATSELAKSASRALSALYAKFKNAGGMAFDVYTKLYTSLVEPVLFYGSGIWGLTDYGKINTVQNKACRYFLGVGKNAANVATQGDMGWTSCYVKQRLETCRLYCKIRNITNDRLIKQIFTWSNSHGKCWERRFVNFVNDLGLSNIFDHDTISVQTAINLCKTKLIIKDQEKWKSSLFNDKGQINGNKMRTYRLYKKKIEAETYVKIPLSRDHRRILAMFRCGNLPLHIETGRYARPKLPVEQRTCFLCTDGIENEIHFLIECPFYDDIRRKLFQKAQKSNTDFNSLNSSDKLVFLMNSVNMQFYVASTLYEMFSRRKNFIHVNI